MTVYGLDPLMRSLALVLLEAHQSVNGTCGQCRTQWPCQAPGVITARNLLLPRDPAPPLPRRTPTQALAEEIKAAPHEMRQALSNKPVGARSHRPRVTTVLRITDGNSSGGRSRAGMGAAPTARETIGWNVIADTRRFEKVLALATQYSR